MLFFFNTPPSSEPILPSLSILAVLPSAGTTAAVQATVLGLVGIAILLRFRQRLRGTTLSAAWCWALVSVCCIAATTVLLATTLHDSPAKLRQALYFAAAMTSFCPLMAVLGAKRPQHRAWQWIVLALWVVLTLPSGEWLLFNRGGEIHAARSWFLAILIGLGAINYLPTRFRLASMLFAAGELILVGPYLPGSSSAAPPLPHVALGWLVAALAAATWLTPRRARGSEPLDCVWRDFRDLFGMVWAMRVTERLNFIADQNRWPVRLRWAGFQEVNPDVKVPLSADQRGQISKNLRSLLLPFVSAEWLAERLP
jgi:hypothetical protein